MTTGANVRRSPYRFLNPYNFVRFLPQTRPKDDLLGDCPPTPHDRYLGVSGRIRCELEVVTPLFVSDSHGIQEAKTSGTTGRERVHQTYRFFTYGGQEAIPASSLRGMVRSVFEAATNSCFGVFEDRHHSYRLEAARAATLVPARVEMDKQRKLWVRLLPGFMPVIPGERPRNLYAASIPRYSPIQGRRTPPAPVPLNGLKHGDKCAALVGRDGLFTIVTAIAADSSGLRQPRVGETVVPEAWLCINNQNIETKHSERVFFASPPTGVAYPSHVPLTTVNIARYQELIADYQERFAEDVTVRHRAGLALDAPAPSKSSNGPTKEPGLSRYMYDSSARNLRPGDLVYVSLTGPVGRPDVAFIAPAAVPRVAYDSTTGDLLPAHFQPCDAHESGPALCPACRMFGWVTGAHERGRREMETATVSAVAGRLRFGHGRLVHDAGSLPPTTLAILSSPKPTTTRFYLMPADGKPLDGLSDWAAGYDANNILRGRKVYRHHGKARSIEYVRAPRGGSPAQDDQNRTVEGAKSPGTTFAFEVDFDNVHPAELGALLWSLELQDEACHRLGYAKPLGFGSVRVRVLGVERMDPTQRYKSLEVSGGWTSVERTEWQAWVDDAYKGRMSAHYGTAFEELPSIRDLRALLREPPALPIHYPRTDVKPSPDGKNFEWFVGNKRSGRQGGPKVGLDLADADGEGLPLIDRSGRTLD